MQGNAHESDLGGGIYRRDGIFIAGYREPSTGKWRTKKLSARNVTEARRQRESLLSALREGRAAPTTGLTFESAFHDWQDSRTLSPRTRKHERHLLERHLAEIKHRRIQDVTATELARRLREMAAPTRRGRASTSTGS